METQSYKIETENSMVSIKDIQYVY